MGSWEDCYLSDIDSNPAGVLLEFVLFFYCFVGLAIVCDDYLVVSLETLVQKLKIPEDVAGASFMAFGSAAPEIIINAVSTVKSAASTSEDSTSATDLGIGAILGSGMIAFMVIPGVCALGSEDTLLLKRRPLLRDISAYAIALVCLCVFFGDGDIQLFPDAIVLVLIYFVYIFVLVSAPKVRRAHRLRLGKVVRTTTFVEEQKQKRRLLDERSDDLVDDKGDGLENGFVDDDEDDIGIGVGAAVEDDEVAGVNKAISNASTGDNYVPLNDDDEEAEKEGKTSESDDHNVKGIWPFVMKSFNFAIAPVRFAFEWTCPSCEIWDESENVENGRPAKAKNPREWAWPITFTVSFFWVALFSFVISAIAQRWCDLLNADVGFFGMAIVAVGAEIPDTIQSITVARRGYGAMAVSNCLGSQICNICLGLGLPWTFSNLLGHKITVHQEENLRKTAFFQVGIVAISFVSLLGFAFMRGANKASLTKFKGKVYIVIYAGVLGALAIMTFA
eukprot:g4640.t1